MPTYQYRCKNCNQDLEVVQRFTDDPLTQCPHCENGELRKVFNAVGVVFKGSGFYRTDSRKNDSAGSKDSSAKSSQSGDKSTSNDSSAKKESTTSKDSTPKSSTSSSSKSAAS